MVDYKWNTDDDEEVESYETSVDEEIDYDEEEVEEEPVRGTEKPETGEVSFNVLRPYTWHDTKFEVGQHTLPEDEFDAMSYDVNLRTDRIIFFTKV